MKYFYITLIILLCAGCAAPDTKDMAKPENFKYFEGTLTHLYKNVLVVESDDGQKINFKAGRNTVFIPKEGRRMRDFLNTGDKLRIKYFIKTYSHRQIGDYFIAFEVSKVK